jgi:hypothetical protein
MIKLLAQKKRILMIFFIIGIIALSGTQVMAQIHQADSMNCATKMVCGSCAPTLTTISFQMNHEFYPIETVFELLPDFPGSYMVPLYHPPR